MILLWNPCYCVVILVCARLQGEPGHLLNQAGQRPLTLSFPLHLYAVNALVCAYIPSLLWPFSFIKPLTCSRLKHHLRLSPAVTDRMLHIFRKLLTDHLPEREKLLMWTWNFARLKLSWKCRKQQASTISNSHLWATLIKLSHCDIWMKEPILNTPISSPLYINA